jgi:hypothetical protein
VRDNIPTSSAEAILSFFRYLDDQNYDKIPSLFADDGVWHRRDQAIKGPGKVRQSLVDLPIVMPTVHLVTNLQIDPVSATEAHAIFYVMALRPSDILSAGPPWPMEAPLLVTLYKAHLIFRAGAWRFKTLRNEPIFRR